MGSPVIRGAATSSLERPVEITLVDTARHVNESAFFSLLGVTTGEAGASPLVTLVEEVCFFPPPNHLEKIPPLDLAESPLSPFAGSADNPGITICFLCIQSMLSINKFEL